MSWGATARLQKFWDIRAAGNFIGGGTGSSLMLFAALGLVAGLPYAPAAIVGLGFVAAGLFSVWLEIGKPWRAFNVFFRPQTSWMTREGIVAMPMFAAGAVAILSDASFGLHLLSFSPVVPASLAALLALTFLYCQLHILNSAHGLPAWNEPRAMTLIGLSGLTEGLGVYLLLNAILGTATFVMSGGLIVLLLARALMWPAYFAALARSSVPESTLAALRSVRTVFLVVGHMLPAALIAAALAYREYAGILLAVAGVTAAVGGWFFKVKLVTRAAYIPQFDIPNAPVRGERGSMIKTERTT